MTTITSPVTGAHLTATGVLRSEWIKLRSVRSPFWSYAIAIAVTV